MTKIFNSNKLEKLNNPKRVKMINPHRIIEILKAVQGKTLLDVGAGTGVFTLEAAEYFNVTALDLSEQMISYLKNEINVRGLENIKLYLGEIDKLQEKYDAIVMIHVLHELEDLETFLFTANNLLNMNGEMIILEWKKELTKGGPKLDHRISSDDIYQNLPTNLKVVNYYNWNEPFYLVHLRKEDN